MDSLQTLGSDDDVFGCVAVSVSVVRYVVDPLSVQFQCSGTPQHLSVQCQCSGTPQPRFSRVLAVNTSTFNNRVRIVRVG